MSPYRIAGTPGATHFHYCPECRVTWPCSHTEHFVFDGPIGRVLGVVMRCSSCKPSNSRS